MAKTLTSFSVGLFPGLEGLKRNAYTAPYNDMLANKMLSNYFHSPSFHPSLPPTLRILFLSRNHLLIVLETFVCPY